MYCYFYFIKHLPRYFFEGNSWGPKLKFEKNKKSEQNGPTPAQKQANRLQDEGEAGVEDVAGGEALVEDKVKEEAQKQNRQILSHWIKLRRPVRFLR